VAGAAANSTSASRLVEGKPGFDPARARSVLLILAATALMVTYVETMVVPAIVRFSTFFGQPISLAAWILSAYLLVGVALTPIFGKLGDLYGKKRVLLVLLVVYSFAVTLAGFTPEIGSAIGLSRPDSIYLLIAVRGLQGVGLAMFPLAFAMIGDEFPPNRVAGAQGAVSAMFAAGAALGLFGGAYLTQTHGWQFTYHTIVPVSILVVILAAWRLPESRSRLAQRLDIPGSAFLAGGLGSFLTALSQGPTWGWGNASAVSLGGIPFGVPELFVLALLFTVAFLLWEPRSPSPIVDFARLKERNIWVSNVNGVLAGTGMFLVFVATTYLSQIPGPGLGLNVLQYGLLSLPTAIAMLIFGPLIGRAISRNGPKPIMILGGVTMAVGGALLALFNRTPIELVLATIPAMVGVIALFIAMTNVIVLSSRKTETGIQTGMNATFRTLGQSLGPVVATTILSSVTGIFYLSGIGPGGVPYQVPIRLPTLLAFQYVFVLGSILGVVSVLLSLGLTNFRYLADGTQTEGRAPAEAPARVRPVSVVPD
jgi:MFS family permease